MKFKNANLNFELDSGSLVSIASNSLYRQHFSNLPLHKANLNLVSSCNTKIQILGYVRVKINCKRTEAESKKLYITEGNKKSIMCRDWMYSL